ncbi:MAG: hypothetical protein MPJ50_15190 [Pirellulales bacterium]|nr:hypothetical protein [Pirellulales bacterium]
MKRTANNSLGFALLITLTATLLTGCARPQTFADPGASPYQPPVVSPGEQAQSTPLGTPNPANQYPSTGYPAYSPPSQSYNYGAQYAPSTNGLSNDTETQAMYEKLYGPPTTTNLPATTTPSTTSPPTLQENVNSGQDITTNRPASGTDGVPDPVVLPRGGTVQLDNGQQPNNGRARPMVPIQSSPDRQGDPADGDRSTLLHGPASGQPDPPAPPVPGERIVGSSPGATESGGTFDESGGSSWPSSFPASRSFPRRRVPLTDRRASTDRNDEVQGTDTSGNDAQADSEATPTILLKSNVMAGPANHSGESFFPPGGQWPQKPIPLPRKAG